MVEDRPKRKELLPLARTQLKIVTIVCLPVVLACVIVTVLQVYFFVTSVRSSMSLEDEFTSGIVPTAVGIAAITLFALVPTFIALTVWVTHRIVGPMRRLTARLEHIAEGKIGTNFHFREGDELVFVADAVAKLEDSLRERIQACLAAGSEAEMRERLAAFELSAPPAPEAQPEEDQGEA